MKSDWWVDPRESTPPPDFRIVVDTREQRPLFQAPGHTYSAPPFDTWAVPGTLATGDYSIQGREHRILVERKSLADLYQSVGRGRERFEREFLRLRAVETRILVIESSYRQMAEPLPGELISFMQPTSVEGTVLSWWDRYGVVPVWVGEPRMARRFVFRLLARWWVEHGEEL